MENVKRLWNSSVTCDFNTLINEYGNCTHCCGTPTFSYTTAGTVSPCSWNIWVTFGQLGQGSRAEWQIQLHGLAVNQCGDCHNVPRWLWPSDDYDLSPKHKWSRWRPLAEATMAAAPCLEHMKHTPTVAPHLQDCSHGWPNAPPPRYLLNSLQFIQVSNEVPLSEGATSSSFPSCYLLPLWLLIFSVLISPVTLYIYLFTLLSVSPNTMNAIWE